MTSSSKPLTTTEFAVLGLLFEAPRHGYELDAMVEQRGLRSWVRLPPSSIYFVLKKLAGRCLIKATHTTTTTQRQRFHITELGLRALRERTVEALASIDGAREDFLIGCLLVRVAGPDATRSALERRRVALAAALDEVAARHGWTSTLPQGPALVCHEQALLQAELDWLDAHTDQLVDAGPAPA